MISIDDLKIKNQNELKSVSAIKVRTFSVNEENNNFKIVFKKKISVIGNSYDATYLLKQLASENKTSLLKNFSKDNHTIPMC